MKLSDLHGVFLGAGGQGVYDAAGNQAPARSGVGVKFDCPCGCDRPVYVPFANPLDGGAPLESHDRPAWTRTGDTIETLTLSPSILRIGGCCWHGFIEQGGVRTV